MLASLLVSFAEARPTVARPLVTALGRVATLVPSQRRAPHWLLSKLIHRTWARIPVHATMAHGFDLVVPLDDYVHRALRETRDYEPETRAILERVLTPGMTMIDAGAHVGVFTLIGARAVGSGGAVHSFEADPAMAKLLERNVRRTRLDNVIVNPVALSDRPGQATFFIASDAGVSSLRPAKKDLYRTRAITVPMMSLADYLRDHRVERVDLIKIDVEGAELSVLRSVERLLEGPHAPLLIIEFAPERQRAFGSSANELARWLRDLRYRLFRIDGSALTPLPEGVDEDDKAIYNALAVPPGRSGVA